MFGAGQTALDWKREYPLDNGPIRRQLSIVLSMGRSREGPLDSCCRFFVTAVPLSHALPPSPKRTQGQED